MDAQGFEATLLALAEKEYPSSPEDWLADFTHEAEPGEKFEVASEIVTVEVVDTEQGGEDKFAGGVGEVYLLFKVTSSGGEQYFKKTGTYHSHAGTEWHDSYIEVRPTTKTVVVYE